MVLRYEYDEVLEILQKHAKGTSQELEYMARQITKVSRSDYEENISYYKDLVKKIKKEEGIA